MRLSHQDEGDAGGRPQSRGVFVSHTQSSVFPEIWLHKVGNPNDLRNPSDSQVVGVLIEPPLVPSTRRIFRVVCNGPVVARAPSRLIGVFIANRFLSFLRRQEILVPRPHRGHRFLGLFSEPPPRVPVD